MSILKVRIWIIAKRLVSFDYLNSSCAIDVKVNRSNHYAKPSCKMLGLSFSSKLNWGYYIVYIAKTAPKKFGALIWSKKCLFPEVALCLFVSVNLPYGLAWNTLLKYFAIICQQNPNSLAYVLNGFKSRVNRHLLVLDSF